MGRRSLAEKSSIANAVAPPCVPCPDPNCTENTADEAFQLGCMSRYGRCSHRDDPKPIGPTKQVWWIRWLKWLVR